MADFTHSPAGENEKHDSDSHAYVPGCSYDVCISFADVDDEALYGAEEGWVSRFTSDLRGMLGQKLGGLDLFSLWSAHQLPGNVSMSSEIESIVSSSATLVAILSPGYIFSEWCQGRTNRFLQMVSKRSEAGSRVFVVEREHIDDEERPPEFKDLMGYKFWVDDREGKAPRPLDVTIHKEDRDRHYDILHDLSSELAKELKLLKQSTEKEPSAEPAEVSPSQAQGTVFLAEATDDLYFEREKVKRYLGQLGIDVVPQSLYPRDPKAFKKAVQVDIEQSDIFVQLLSSVPFKLSPDLPEGSVRCQYTLAKDAGKDVLQWRSPDLELAGVQDAEQRNFLDAETVLAVTLEEFKAKIVKELSSSSQEEEKATFQRIGEKPLIFVHADQSDVELSKQICQRLKQFGAECLVPVREGKPSEIREYFKMFVRESEAILLVYGNTSPTWVTAQEFEMRKFLRYREEPPKALALYKGPPPPKRPVPSVLPNLLTIECQNTLVDAEIRKFFDAVSKGGAAL
ncbi:MAG: hypothetical protein GY801_02130 [bacterium]|nr:hypothetical protein [bacterium]